MSLAENGAEAFVLGRPVILGSEGLNSQAGENVGEILATFDEDERIDPALATILEQGDTEDIHASHSDGRGGYENTERLIIRAIDQRHLALTQDCHVTGADVFASRDADRSFIGLTLDARGIQIVRSVRGSILGHFNISGRKMSRDPFVRVGMAEHGYAAYIARSISGLLTEPLKVTMSPDYYIEPSEEI